MKLFTRSTCKIHARRLLWLCTLALTLSGLVACRPTERAQNLRRFDLRGKVISVDKAQQQLIVAHEEIPDFMKAMTMPFTLKDRDALEVAAAGDLLQATLVVADDGYWLENPVITKGGGEASETGAVAGSPQRGAEVPDFSLVNQDGKRIRLSQYRPTRALLLTFIYTRCPLPEYCSLMSSNFAELERHLKSNEVLYGRTHLLSISIDPEYDTPKVLRSYGGAYTENYKEEKFDHWEFATGKPEEIKSVAGFFGLNYNAEQGEIVHSLRTAIITPEGRVYKVYSGNEWKPSQMLRDLEEMFSANNSN